VKTLNAADVPCGPVYTAADVFADPHVEARGVLMDVGGVKFARTVAHVSANPQLPAEPAARLGQHTRTILQDVLGYSGTEVDALVSEQVVQTDEA
jgi:formyl-CoA transferase